MNYLTLLGSTGSIGCNTLDIVRHNPDKYTVTALVAGKNVKLMAKQCLEFIPKYAVMDDENNAKNLKKILTDKNINTEVLSGQNAACEMASLNDVDQVMVAIVGVAGLMPTLASIKAGKTVLLANKELLVMCGSIIMKAVKKYNARILPVDSEHNAIFQNLPKSVQNNLGFVDLKRYGVSSIVITGSGGPFLETPLSKFSSITPKQACCHPNWSMGKKVSIDSATMMNKGLECIEARWLFNLSIEEIEVLIHPQSIIHSMVRYLDGSLLAHLGTPDMRIPISYSMAWPNRIVSGANPINLTKINSLTFSMPDYEKYPCLKLAMETFNSGQVASTILNAANEVAVSAFLNNRISFEKIAIINISVLEKMDVKEPKNIEEVLLIDAKTREIANKQVLYFEK